VEGRTLGSYKVLERLGAGGQGHVYRALDTTLDREIAIKVLPAEFLAEPERLKRFQQEAKLLAAASHPNIAAVYAIEEFDGVHFFTQELVPGRPLSAIISEGPLDLEDTLEIGRQIATALEMAHERRLIHRDLKPANIMVTPAGGVKVLDFGLALPVDRDEGEDNRALSDSTPTISRTTADSVIVGTAPYMSPDQARGRMVDRRTDIWSFGCVLYECLTASRPFEGETLLDTLSAIVRGEPDWDRLSASTPKRLRHLIQRCLRKRISDRLQHIGDARIVLEEVLAEPLPAPELGAAGTPVATARKPSWSIALAAAVGGMLIGAAVWAWMSPASESSPPMRAVVMLDPARLDVDRSSALGMAPDGSAVVYAASHQGRSQLYYRSLDSFEATPIDGTAGGENPFYSPSGDWIGFFSSDFTLAKVPTGGGVVVTVCEVPVGNWGAVWLPDETIVYGTNSTGWGLMQVPAGGGTPVAVTTLEIDDGETGHGWPHALPGGRAVLFTVTTASGSSVAVVDLETRERRTVIESAADARYVEPGHLVYAQKGTLFATAFDLDRMQPLGAPRPVVDNLFAHSRGDRASYTIGANGALVYAPGATGPRRDRLVWVDRQGNAEQLPIEAGNYNHPRLSPDNNYIAYEAMQGGRGDVWVYDIRRQITTRLTATGDNVMPVWAPHGMSIVFASSGRGAPGLFSRQADGGGETHELLVRGHSLWPISWHDQTIAYYELNPETGRDIWLYGLAGGQKSEAEPFQRSRFNERSPMFSPDGQWIAYVSNESGRDEVYVREYRGNGRRHTISDGGGSEPVWSPDGSELFYRFAGFLFAVPIEPSDVGGANEFRAGSPEALFPATFKIEVVAGNQMYDIAADGRHFVMIDEDDALRGPDRLHLVLDWARELTADGSGGD